MAINLKKPISLLIIYLAMSLIYFRAKFANLGQLIEI